MSNRSRADAAAAAAIKTIPLIDPTFRGGLIEVPVSKTVETKGRADFMKGTLQKDLSLCCLFQRGRCSLQERCHQIHVDTNYMASVRRQNEGVVSCCRRCKDTASLTSSAVSFFAMVFDEAHRTITVNCAPGVDKTVDAEMIAFTTGLEMWIHEAKGNAAAVVPTRKVCRLHLGGRCKYGKDCKYVHLCSTLGEDFLSAAPSRQVVAAPKAPTTVSSTVSSQAAKQPAKQEAWRGRSAAAETAPPRTNSFYTAKVKSAPADNGFFNRVSEVSSETSNHSRSASVPELTPGTDSLEAAIVEDVPSYFTADRFTAAPQVAVTAAAERSASGMFPKSTGSSCLERSVALTGLCFDPALLWDHIDDLPSAKKNADMFAGSCELLSTTCSETASLPSTKKLSRECAFY